MFNSDRIAYLDIARGILEKIKGNNNFSLEDITLVSSIANIVSYLEEGLLPKDEELMSVLCSKICEEFRKLEKYESLSSIVYSDCRVFIEFDDGAEYCLNVDGVSGYSLLEWVVSFLYRRVGAL